MKIINFLVAREVFQHRVVPGFLGPVSDLIVERGLELADEPAKFGLLFPTPTPEPAHLLDGDDFMGGVGIEPTETHRVHLSLNVFRVVKFIVEPHDYVAGGGLERHAFSRPEGPHQISPDETVALIDVVLIIQFIFAHHPRIYILTELGEIVLRRFAVEGNERSAAVQLFKCFLKFDLVVHGLNEFVSCFCEKITEMVHVTFTKLDEDGAGPLHSDLTGNHLPIGVLPDRMNVTPVLTERRKDEVFCGLIVALLTVALDAHGLIIPVRVAALLTLRDDVIPIHQNQPVLVGLVEQIYVAAAALVFPSNDLVAHSATTNTLATMDSEALEVGHTETTTVTASDPSPFTDTKGLPEAFLDGERCQKLHVNESDGIFINVKAFLLSR